jgi:hypothetical protein
MLFSDFVFMKFNRVLLAVEHRKIDKLHTLVKNKKYFWVMAIPVMFFKPMSEQGYEILQEIVCLVVKYFFSIAIAKSCHFAMRIWLHTI